MLYSNVKSNYSNKFDQLNHLHDSIPDPNNKGHYAKFNDIYGAETTEEHMPSLHITTSKNHGITFIPLLQHAKNTGLTVKCTECNKPRLVYSQKKISVSLPRKFKLATDKLWFTCGATVKELIGTEQQFADLFIRVSLTCQKPVEAIYYSVGSYPNCCCHCGST